MRKNFKKHGQRGIYCIFKQNQNIKILYSVQYLYPAYFQLFIKYAYIIFVMKDCVICTENGKRERNGFSKNY